jgi:hypothetical protein
VEGEKQLVGRRLLAYDTTNSGEFSKVEGGKELEKSDQSGELARGKLLAEFGVDGAALVNEEPTVVISFGGELEQKSSSGSGFFFGDEFFADEGFDGAVNDGAVEAEDRGNLILVEGSATA